MRWVLTQPESLHYCFHFLSRRDGASVKAINLINKFIPDLHGTRRPLDYDNTFPTLCLASHILQVDPRLRYGGGSRRFTSGGYHRPQAYCQLNTQVPNIDQVTHVSDSGCVSGNCDCCGADSLVLEAHGRVISQSHGGEFTGSKFDGDVREPRYAPLSFLAFSIAMNITSDMLCRSPNHRS